MFLLDTNVISELRRPERADRNVRRWASETSSVLFFMSAITVLEIELGILRIERRDAAQAAVLRGWFDGRVMPGFAGRILPVDAAAARMCAGLHVPDPRPERDALIAATALAHGLTVVTRNAADFAGLGVGVLNPWVSA